MSKEEGTRRRRKEARPAECIAAALDVFAERGFAAATLDEIARRAGISKGTLYLYFENKEALFKAVVQETLLPTIVEGEGKLVEASADPATLLREMVEKWSSMITTTKAGEIPKLIIAEATKFPDLAAFFFEHIVFRGHLLLSRVLELGIAQGVFRPCDPELFCNLVLAPVMQHCLWHKIGLSCGEKDVDPKLMVDVHMEIFLRGLLVREGEERTR